MLTARTNESIRLESNPGNPNIIRNRTGYQSGDLAYLDYSVGRTHGAIRRYVSPFVIWLRDGMPARSTSIDSSIGGYGPLNTTLSFVFEESDAGVYQCLAFSYQTFAIAPIRLDTGEY